MPLFDTVLVANRGEIARRVIRTLRRLGIRSVAVHSDADAGAPFVREADVAVRIGPAPASASYLSIEAVLAAAGDTGAQAVHPGYGFLSENVAFARACAVAGIVFIGPGERALQIMGDKIRAKEHVAAYGVPTIPGFSAADMTDDQIADAAAYAGYPLLVKPSAGGGGKGMHAVEDAAALPDALHAARRVAAASFGDDTLLLERLIARPRHIEVQVFADHHGHVIHLGERECTLQRRHQKVIEEAPSPVVDAETRARLGAAACAAAASVDYRGAGTVEFLVAADRPDEFFFIEMNTRLQVEHPVTELVTGLDLVELQLRVAAGEPLTLMQEDVRLDGHAIEARVYAEEPANAFLPATGAVLHFAAAPDARTDSAVETGSMITTDYDPMIAKVITHADDRATALDALDTALADTVVLGVPTNIAFLRALLAEPGVRAGDMDTGLIERMPVVHEPRPSDVALAAVAEPRPAAGEGVWGSLAGLRLGAAPARAQRRFVLDTGEIVAVLAPEAGPLVSVGARRGGTRRVGVASVTADATSATGVDGRVWVHAQGATGVVRPVSRSAALTLRLASAERVTGAASPELRSPMPGGVVSVSVSDGDTVRTGDRIIVIEAMKMEHPVLAAHDGVISLLVDVGDQVRQGQVLASVTPANDIDPPEEAP